MDHELQAGAMIVNAVVKEKLTPEMPIEEKAKICFEAALSNNNTWFTSDENTLFLAGVAALMSNVEEEDKARIKAEIDFLKKLGAASALGIPVDLGSLMRGLEDVECIGLYEIWKPLWHEGKKR